LAEQALNRKLTPAGVSSYWTAQAFGFIQSQPVRWLQLLTRKFALACNAVEVMDTEDQYTHARWSWPLRIFGRVWHFGFVLPLAVLGLMTTWPQRERMALLYFMLAGYVASLVIFYIMGRYRLPLIPVLLVFSAAGVTQVRDFWQRSPRLVRVGATVTLLAIAVFANWPLLNRPIMGAATFDALGTALRKMGRSEEAVTHYQEALRINPDSDEAHNNMGVALSDQGRFNEAVAHYKEALRIKPDYAAVHNNWGNALVGLRRPQEALAHYQEACRIMPDFDEAHNNWGHALQGLGRPREAVTHYQQALRINPDFALAHYNWGYVLVQQGRLEEAVSQFQDGLRVDPDNAVPHYNLAVVLVMQGRLPDAIEHLRHALRLEPDYRDARHKLREVQTLLQQDSEPRRP